MAWVRCETDTHARFDESFICECWVVFLKGKTTAPEGTGTHHFTARCNREGIFVATRSTEVRTRVDRQTNWLVFPEVCLGKPDMHQT